MAGFPLPKLLGHGGGESQSGNAEEYLHRGEDRAGKKDYDGAIADYSRALQLRAITVTPVAPSPSWGCLPDMVQGSVISDCEHLKPAVMVFCYC